MSKKSRRSSARRALLTLSLVLVVAFAAVGGTIAWLTAQTTAVTNTFSPSSIAIDLKEHEYNPNENAEGMLGSLGTAEVTEEDGYKLIPGSVLPKDPFVTVKAGSESCYVFVKIEESENFDDYLTYTNGAKWAPLSTTDGSIVWYWVNGNADKTVPAAVDASATNVVLDTILDGNKVTVKDVSSETMDLLYNADGTVNTDKLPTLTFTAYAVQSLNNITVPATLWDQAQGIATGN